MGHNLATDIFTVILIVLGTCAVAIPVTIGIVLQLQKEKVAIHDKIFGVFYKK
jgi:hypothetical protein